MKKKEHDREPIGRQARQDSEDDHRWERYRLYRLVVLPMFRKQPRDLLEPASLRNLVWRPASVALQIDICATVQQ